MYTSLHAEKGILKVNIPRYLRRHDIVYRRPPLNGYEGLPVGNGVIGGLVYHAANALLMTVNHADAVDYAPDGDFRAWAWEAEEKSTARFSCGELRLSSTLPLFDWMYLEDFEQRLNLAEGTLTCHAKTPFSDLRYTMYASADPSVLVLEVDLRQSEATELTVSASKWASPNFYHHYEQVVRLHDKHLDGTSCTTDGKRLLVGQTMRKCTSTLAMEARGEAYEVIRLSSHGGELRFPPSTHHRFTLFVAAQADEPDTKKSALAALELCGDADLYAKHTERWHCFWSRSFVHLTDDYVENLYYLHLYQLGSCGLGKHPVTFGGLWTWFRDTCNWGHFYHWNHQQTYWGLHSANHPELVENYLHYRTDMLPQARENARALFGSSGAFYSDISNLNGYNALEPDTCRNVSVAAQIAMDFYKHWQFTQDGDFLRNRAIPMLLAAFQLYADLLEEDAQGVLRLRGGSTCYESYWNLKETLTDAASIRAVVRALRMLEGTPGVPSEVLAACERIEQDLYPLPTEIKVNGEVEKILFAAGTKWDGTTVVYGEGEYPLSPFPATLLSPVYPAGIVGLKDRGTELFAIAQNTVRELLEKDVYTLGVLGCSGHAPTPQATARLGLAEEMPRLLRHFADTYQRFPNGLMHFADLSQNQQWSPVDRPRVLEPDVQNTCYEEIHDKSKGIRTAISSDWFLHCYFEAAANLFEGVNEMLLQSYDGVIRVFPAVTRDEPLVFRLAAAGGFLVTAEQADGMVRYVSVESGAGSTCRIELPWAEGTPSLLREGKQHPFIVSDGIATFETEQGGCYLLQRAEYPVENDYCNDFAFVVNEQTKYLGRVQLGLEAVYPRGEERG